MSEEVLLTQKKKKKALIVNIILYVISGLLLALTIFGIVARLSSTNGFFIFDHRFDVVLTNSMSAKNPEYEDFLRGHDDQIQKFDLVVSKKIQSEEELSVYDIVLFQNPGIGVDMHRIVGKELYSKTTLTATKSSYITLGNYEGVCLNKYESAIVSNAISLKEITLVTYSTLDDTNEHFYFSILHDHLNIEKTKESVAGGVITTYSITRESKTPGPLVINHAYSYAFENEIVTSCSVTMYDEKEPITLSKSVLVAEGDDLVSTSNRKYNYTIRGDLSNTADGEFKIDSIISKVTGVAPKIGYVVRYLTSIWGIILFASLGVIILVYDILSSKLKKKEELAKLEQENKKEKE